MFSQTISKVEEEKANKVNDEMQNKLAIKSLFQSSGYKIFKESLDDLVAGTQDDITNLQKNSVDQGKLSQLNFKLGMARAYEQISNVLRGMLEEIEDKK